MIFKSHAEAAPNLFALPPGRPFFDDLVAAILSDYGSDVGGLAALRLFVPSRRAERAVKEAFARQAPRGAIILPRISAASDLSEDDPLILAQIQSAPGAKAPAAAIKRLKIAGIYRDAMAERGRPLTWQGALRGASELVRTSDQLTEYGVSTDDLLALKSSEVLEGAAEHWREVSEILSLVSERYPAWLISEGLVDARQQRAEQLARLTEALSRDTQTPLVIAAGFMGTSPSTQEFLRSIAFMPNGAVVLPALDLDMPHDAWAKIEAPHPQASYKELFTQCMGDVVRQDVRMLPYENRSALAARRALLSLALTPAEATSDWGSALTRFAGAYAPNDALRGLQYAVARTSEEEADFVALALREVLEEPEKTAAFVTADRELARRVAAKLRGWGIEIDDSGGAPIRGSYRATFLRLISELIAEPSNPRALAGLIHHQLFGISLDPDTRRPLVQAFDRFLRGRAPRQGWEGLARSLDDDWRPYRPESNRKDRDLAADLLMRLRRIFREHLPSATDSVSTILSAHLRIAEDLASTDVEHGRERLYRFEDGEVLEPHFETLQQRADLLGESPIEDYPAVFEALLEGPAFRPPGGQHPRLALYGILEARLQTADHFIVGGLQEGVWPGDAFVDPFLSRSMRRILGLPSPDADIGRVAHDFLDFASKPKVLLTRSARRGNAPARASRLMIRLERFLAKLDPEGACNRTETLRAWRKARFGGEGTPEPARPPSPQPPSSSKPERLSVSDISTWLRDPYAIYARHILKLRPLASYDEAFGSAHRGTLLHSWFEAFGRLQLDEATEAVEQRLSGLLDEILADADMPSEQRTLNAQFIARAMHTFCAFETEALRRGRTLALEADASAELSAGPQKIRIHGRADRVDALNDGGVHIIDYKLGDGTTVKQGQSFSPQLFVLALMMEEGGFQGLNAQEVNQISYLPLKDEVKIFGGKDEGKGHLRGEALREALAEFKERFGAWLADQYAEGAEFPSQLYPYRTDIIGDYDDLARRSEWAGEQDDD